MPLNKFIPLSPDPNITTSSDMGLAQFGHLNTIVDYLNGTEALSNLKIDGTLFFNSYSGGTASIIITHSGYNQDPLTYIGGGATLIVGGYYSQYLSTPYNQGYGNTVLGIYASIIAHDNSYFNTVIGYGASVTINEPGNVVVGKSATSSVANAVAIGRNTSVSGYEASAIGYGAVTTTNFAVALGNSNSKLQIGGNFVPTARVHIKGLGSTSATTSLLVQNSGGVSSLQVADNGNVLINTTTDAGFRLDVNGTARISGNVELPTTSLILQAGISGFAGSGNVLLGNNFNIRAMNSSNTGTMNLIKSTSGNNIEVGGSNHGNTFINPTLNSGQTVVVGDNVVVASAVLNVSSTTKGFLKPRLTTAQKNAIATPAAGLEVYDTDLNRPCFYSGSAWVTL